MPHYIGPRDLLVTSKPETSGEGSSDWLEWRAYNP